MKKGQNRGKMPARKSKKVKPSAGYQELPSSALFLPCDPDSFNFENTSELSDLHEVIGQPRAFRSLQLASEVAGPGYNTFVMGLPSSGRTTLSREFLERLAASQPIPDDWCYVNNFDDPLKPHALHFPARKGQEFRKKIKELVRYCAKEIPRRFESEEYTQERDQIINKLKKEQEQGFAKLHEIVESNKFVLGRTSSGFILAPAANGQALKPEELEKLTPEERENLREVEARLSTEIEKNLLEMRDLEISATEQMQGINAKTVTFLIGPLIRDLRALFGGTEAVDHYLNAIQEDIITNAAQFISPPSAQPDEIPLPGNHRNFMQRYEVNLLVDNSAGKGAPVVIENYPVYNNLVGRIDHEMILGASRTDFTMIRPGALHRANGGYLVIPARDVLINPHAWDGLKRGLRDEEIHIIELANQLGILSTTTLEPDPIPLKIKVLLIGTPALYYTLRAYDEDFTRLFKVRAEFATTMDRTSENEFEYSLFINSVIHENHLLPFDSTAIARIVEQSARMAEDQHKLSTRFGKVADLVREADYCAGKQGHDPVTAEDVQQAIDEAVYRSNLYEERMQEVINQDTLMIDVTGAVSGQINALSVFMLGDYQFGRPTRVTAVAFPGRTGVVDIERQAKLGGALHTKGVLILSGYINRTYSKEQPLALAASLTFEQTYDEVQGDSASAAELLALLSAIAQVPLRQDRAITGSINQLGQIQAIGGVNEKIEGYFAVCKAKGLTGEQGVIIPVSNQRHLMLKRAVVEAVEAGSFHIWTISSVEESIPLLADREAGTRKENGSYPEGTFNHAVVKQLNDYTKALQASGNKLAPKPGETNGKEIKTESIEG
jgi:lon-related putative ATP-dependent protease